MAYTGTDLNKAERGWVKSRSAVNVKDYGAVGDGTDQTSVLQDALDAGYAEVYIPDGTYLVDADIGLLPASNTKITLSKGAILQAKTNSNTSYEIIHITGVDNVTISGGTIIGERDTHIGSTGEAGMGIYIRNSSNIIIEDMTVKDCWGDGVYVGQETGSSNVKLKNLICDNNRRQGVSLVGINYAVVESCEFKNTNGTSPESGIDIEADAGNAASKIIVRDCYSHDNNGCGYEIHGLNTGEITIDNCVAEDNGIDGIKATRVNDCIISKNKVYNNTLHGIYFGINSTSLSVKGIKVISNIIRNSGGSGIYGLSASATNTFDDILIDGNTIDNSTSTGIDIRRANNAIITSNKITNSGIYGINVGACTNSLFLNNIVDSSALIGIYAESSTFCSFDNNYVMNNQREGFYLNTDCNDSAIRGNQILNNSLAANKAYSGILIKGARINVANNLCRYGTGNQTNYGLNIHSSCVDVYVNANDFLTSGGDGEILDGGTTTVSANNRP